MNFIYSFSSTLIRIVLGVGILSIFYSLLSGSQLANYATGLLVGQILCIFIDSGINSEVLKNANLDDAEENKLRIAESIFIRGGVCTGIFFIIYPLSVILLKENIWFFIFSVYSVFFTSISETYYIGLKSGGEYKKEFHYVAIQAGLVIFISLLGFINEEFIVPSIILSRLLVFIIIGCCFFDKIKYFYNKKITHNIFNYYSRLKFYSFDAIVTNLSLQLDSLAIAFIFGKSVYVDFQPINRVYLATINLASAISGYAIPFVSKIKDNNKKTRALNIMFISFGFVSSFCFFIITPFFLQLAFPNVGLTSSKFIFLYSFLILSRYITASFGSSLMLLGCQKYRANCNFILTVIFVFIFFYFATSPDQILIGLIVYQLFLSIMYFVKLKKLYV